MISLANDCDFHMKIEGDRTIHQNIFDTLLHVSDTELNNGSVIEIGENFYRTYEAWIYFSDKTTLWIEGYCCVESLKHVSSTGYFRHEYKPCYSITRFEPSNYYQIKRNWFCAYLRTLSHKNGEIIVDPVRSFMITFTSMTKRESSQKKSEK